MTDNNELKPQREKSRAERKETSWGMLVPIILVATIVFAAIDNRSDASDSLVRTGDLTFSDSAFLGGIQRKYDSATFQRGEAEAFMGAIDLDFRGAVIEGDEARLDITAVMGGVKIRVPRTWNVVSRVVATMGGVKDRTRSTSDNKRLIIEGTVLMGGIEIYN